jgi:hypothetical protein
MSKFIPKTHMPPDRPSGQPLERDSTVQQQPDLTRLPAGTIKKLEDIGRSLFRNVQVDASTIARLASSLNLPSAMMNRLAAQQSCSVM